MSNGLIDIIALLALCSGGYLFWQWRLQEEAARMHAERICKRYQLQFLDIARISGKPRFTPRLGWQATFLFGFSSDSKSRYEGTLVLLNRQLSDMQLPPHRAHEQAREGATVAAEPSHSKPSASQTAAPQSSTTQRDNTVNLSSRSTLHTIPAPVGAWSVSYGERNASTQPASGAESDDIIEAIFPADNEPLANVSKPIIINDASGIDG